jgi:DNA-binding CsgD family transcriptional regulator
LFEREEPCRQLADAATQACLGNGSITVILGRPGEGKSALLAESDQLCQETGLQVLRAYGSELEQPFGFGIARQLLVPAVRSSSRPTGQLFAQGAATAAGVLDLAEGFALLEEPSARHGLYWLLQELCAETPRALLIDDAHWADEPTLAWLALLAPRVAELPVAVVVTTRGAGLHDRDGALAALLGDPSCALLQLAPLSAQASGALTIRALGVDPGPVVRRECHRLTAGNPFALWELARDLHGGPAEEAELLARLADRSPTAIERSVRRRLAALGDQAGEVGRTLAVLGDHAPLRRVAQLAGIELEGAADTAGRLVDAGILASGPDLAFAHPLILAAVRQGFGPQRLALAHGRAAALLAREGEEAERVAAHLLLAEPAGDDAVVEQLRTAARQALQRSAPGSAAAYLVRALAEPCVGPTRSEVLGELALSAWLDFDMTAIEHLAAARDLAGDPARRAVLDMMLADACFYDGQLPRSEAAIADGLAGLGEAEPVLAAGLRALRVSGLVTVTPGWGPAEYEEHERLAQQLGADGTGREVSLSLALAGVLSGRAGAAQTVGRVRAALDPTMFDSPAAGATTRVSHGLLALLWSDRPDLVLELTDHELDRARSMGSSLRLGLAHHTRALAEHVQGALPDAEADVRLSLELAQARGVRFGEGLLRATLVNVLIDRGELEEAAAELALVEAVPALHGSYLLDAAQLRLARARGDAASAIAGLERIGAMCERIGTVNGSFLPWRAELATLLAERDPDRARALAQAQLSDARRLGLALGAGTALRARALTETPRESMASLVEAVAVLEAGPSRLALGRALVDLGRQLRLSNQRCAARGPLRRGLDLAHGCGARPLIELAGDELRAADGRPRSPYLTGAAALTPSELRVARLAARGHSNQEVAQTLFVTVKTVEMHLTRVYRKLDAGSRGELAQLLGDAG